MHWIFSLYVAFLFFILTPAILVRLPPKAGKFTVAAFHAVVFALVLHFTGKIVWNFCRGLEGFQEGATDAQKRSATGFIQQCQNTMKGTSSVANPPAYNDENTITCTKMTATDNDVKNVCKGNSSYNTTDKICTWTKK